MECDCPQRNDSLRESSKSSRTKDCAHLPQLQSCQSAASFPVSVALPWNLQKLVLSLTFGPLPGRTKQAAARIFCCPPPKMVLAAPRPRRRLLVGESLLACALGRSSCLDLLHEIVVEHNRTTKRLNVYAWFSVIYMYCRCCTYVERRITTAVRRPREVNRFRPRADFPCSMSRQLD